MRRDSTSRLLLLALLAVFGAFAWLTRNPDAPLVENAERWPLVGPAAARFRALWRPPAPPSVQEPTADGPPIVVLEPDEETIERRAALEIEARQRIWVEQGVELRSAPDRGAQVIARTLAISNLPLLERRGDWHRLRRGSVEGWALLEGREDPASPPLGSAPEPVLPLPGRPPDPDLLRAATGLLAPRARTVEAGPYLVYTDTRDDLVEGFGRRVAEGIEELYRRRYGLTPVGEAAEAVVLFRRAADFHSLRRFADDRIPEWVLGFFSRGVVCTHSEGRDPSAVAGTVAHELTHALNRRALGPGLPPWLEEGLAEDLGATARALYTGRPASTGDHTAVSPTLAAAAAGTLPRPSILLTLDEREFHAAELRLVHREVAGLWIRFLLEERALGRGFRRFLASVARGEPLTSELLLASLERDWEQLEADFTALLTAH